MLKFELGNGSLKLHCPLLEKFKNQVKKMLAVIAISVFCLLWTVSPNCSFFCQSWINFAKLKIFVEMIDSYQKYCWCTTVSRNSWENNRFGFVLNFIRDVSRCHNSTAKLNYSALQKQRYDLWRNHNLCFCNALYTTRQQRSWVGIRMFSQW